MNKKELIEELAKDLCSKKEAQVAVNGIFAAIRKVLRKGGSVNITDFGTFSVSKRAARKGRNPQTGEAIKIKATKVPKFKAGRGLKNAVK